MSTTQHPTADDTDVPMTVRAFDLALWQSRILVIVPVVASLLIAIVMFYIATLDTVRNFSYLVEYSGPSPLPEVQETMHAELVSHVVEAIDGYLLGVVMLIFSMGLYELFIRRIVAAEHNDRAKGILVVHSLDDLKARLGQVILLMLIVKFFEEALKVHYQTALELTLMAVGVLLVSASLFLTHKSHQHAVAS